MGLILKNYLLTLRKPAPSSWGSGERDRFLLALSSGSGLVGPNPLHTGVTVNLPES